MARNKCTKYYHHFGNRVINMFDIIVIGGGPSGLMASIAAMEHGKHADGHFKVLLVDKGDQLGRKLGISGGGRCNVTNNKKMDEFIRHIPGNGRFLHSALQTFNNKNIIRFFKHLGIALKEEDQGRMFPVSDRAKTVVQALVNKVKSLGIEIMTNQPVKKVTYTHDRTKGILLNNGEFIVCRSVIIATGGKSVPHTGSTGDGYVWAQAAGHTITPLYPTEVPITSNTSFIRWRELQGLSLRRIALAVWDPKGKQIIEHEGDMIFTHFGVSGPIALRCSQFVIKSLKASGMETVLMSIDLFPHLNEHQLEQYLLKRWQAEPKKALRSVFKELLPDRLLAVLVREADISPDLTYHNLSKKAWSRWLQKLKKFTFKANGTLSIEKAFVTGGGVHLKEIDPKTMASKLMHGLYFCGEILDVHGYTGGYNITAAFSTGYTAGASAAAWSTEQSFLLN